MRGPTVDVRLEAIAGTPVVDVDKPTIVAGSLDGTAVFVGVFEPYERNQATIYAVDRFTGYVRATGVWDSSANLDVMESFGDIYVGVAVGVTESTIFLGRTGSLNFFWQGPMRGLVYDRALTDYQIQRIIQHLTRELNHE